MVAATATPDVIRPQAGPQEAFLSTPADIAIYGGAAGGGKSYALLLEPLRNIDVDGFSALVLRRTTKEVLNVGGLWTDASLLYSRLGAEPQIGQLLWRFRGGNVVKFDHMEYETDKFKYQGSQVPCIEFDELTHFTESQFWYMLSRNRSTCGVSPYIRATCNPDAGSWVAGLVEWWIDRNTGYPILERSGIVRWFVRVGGQVMWGDSRQELLASYPESEPKSFTFIAATLEDNPALTRKDPGYKANLMALPPVVRERLLCGNWKIVDTENSEWPAEYFLDIYDDIWPSDQHLCVVALDPSKGKSDKCDYSAFVAACKGHNGKYYIDANIARRPLNTIVDEGVKWMSYIRPQAFGCEINQFQELLKPLFEEQIEQTGLSMRGVFGIHNGPETAKKTRIRMLSPLLANGRLRFRRSPGTSLLIEQLQAFPTHPYDDGPDALEMAIRLCEELLQGTAYAEPPEEVLRV